MRDALEKGLSETTEGTERDEMDLMSFLRLVRKKIDDFAGDTPQFDDMTMLCLEYRGKTTK